MIVAPTIALDPNVANVGFSNCREPGLHEAGNKREINADA